MATWDPYYYAGNYSISSGSTTAGYLTTTSSSSFTSPLVFTTAAPQALPATRAPLQWLDDEIEKTCALARA